MQDQNKTQNQLVDELNEMRRSVAEFETAQTPAVGTEQAFISGGLQGLMENKNHGRNDPKS